MSKPTSIELLRQLHEIEKMFKNSNVLARRKTELSRLEEKRTGEVADVGAEFENLHALLPEIIASTRRNKNLEKAAFYVGLVRGIFIGLAVEVSKDDEPEGISIAMAVRLLSIKSTAQH
jgi:hypothetical protein